MFRLVAIVLLVAPHAAAVGTAQAPAPVTTAAAEEPRVLAAYPNPVAPNDAGEFVLLSLPANTTVTLTDGEDTVRVADAPGGRVAVTRHPARVRNLTDYPTVPIEGLHLANGGERLELRSAEGETLHVVAYEDAPASELRWFGAGAWRPLGATDVPVRDSGPTNATAFVLPDDTTIVRETLRSARERILVGAYTFSDPAVARILTRAVDRGVTVRVLVEGGPVGGLTQTQARTLDRLTAAGVDVRVLGGPRARYVFHHAKYAVVDDRALVLTENWKPAGTGGNASRGWGVRIDDSDTAAALASTFAADAGWRDARPWSGVRTGRTFVAEPAANGTFPSEFEPEPVRVRNVRVLVAPDNAEAELVRLVDDADTSVRVVGPTVGADGPFVGALLRAARRGVEVRLLLSGAWYVSEENRVLADRLNDLAEREGLSLEARLAAPRGRFEKIHAKGMVIDGDTAVVGSVNWNAHSVRENREVAVVLEGEEAAQYYGRVYRADWQDTTTELPLGLLAAVVLAGLLAARFVEVRFVD